MKGLYRLIGVEFAKWLPVVALLSAAAMFVPLVLVHGRIKQYSEYTVTERFEDVYVASGGALLFAMLLALACVYFLIVVYADYWGSKSIYTYLTLPARREALYLGRLIVFAGCLLCLLAAQLIGIRLGYALYAAKVGSYGDGQYLMHNGFFLAMIRSAYFRLLLPLSFGRLASSFALFAALATGLYYGAICERSRRYYGLAGLAAACWIAFRSVSYRLGENDPYLTTSNLYLGTALLLALSGWFVWHSLYIVKKGAVA